VRSNLANLEDESTLEQLIREANDRTQGGRLDRLKYLFQVEDKEGFPADHLALEYYEEARLCWFVGAFVASIVMSQLAFEELLRSHYRVVKGVRGNLGSGKELDQAGFNDLIIEAGQDGWISPEETTVLHGIRKVRNPYVHPKDVDKREDFFTQTIKIVHPELLGSGTENEARETVKLLVTLFPSICRRL
jgi:Domain of unknown function (DUF4145)